MGREKVGQPHEADSLLLVLDSGPILEGANLVASQCLTTPEVQAEIRGGGATGRRFESLLAGGMAIRSASAGSQERVRETAQKAGSLARLSQADLSVLALALDLPARARLLSDDYTVLDVARRLGVEAASTSKPGIEATKDWTARCAGCGRSFPTALAGRSCPVCGSEVRLRVRRP